MLQRARQEVEAALLPWAALLTNSETWIAELWEPLRRVEELLSGVKEEEGDFLTFQAPFRISEKSPVNHPKPHKSPC